MHTSSAFVHNNTFKLPSNIPKLFSVGYNPIISPRDFLTELGAKYRRFYEIVQNT